MFSRDIEKGLSTVPSTSSAKTEFDPQLRQMIPLAHLDAVADAVERSRRPVRVVMERLGLMSQREWAKKSSEISRLPLVSLEDIPSSLPQDPRLSPAFQQRKAVLLADLSDAGATAIVADPFDPETLRALRQLFGANLRLQVATERDIEAARERETAQKADAENSRNVNHISGSPTEIDDTALHELANDAPTVRFLETLFAEAIEARATDIHIEPQKDGMRIRLRIDGILSERPMPARNLERGILSRIKILAGMDISEKRLPQDGSILQRFGGTSIDMRVATAPGVHGESIVLRLLDAQADLGSLAALNMPAAVLQSFRAALAQPNGLILMTGPTGSGKTTSLHAALGDINDVGRKIVTIENPVEINTPGLVQIEVKPEIGLTFASILRTVLRHDPDVLMVGEIRDAETAELAVRAAMTGHLVFSTLHTNRAGEALARMRDMGVPDYLLRSVLRLAAAQRLVRRLCDCSTKASKAIGPAMIAEIKAMGTLAGDLPAASTWNLRMPKGCAACHGTGYKGRIAVFETLGPAELTASLSQADPASQVAGMPRAAFDLVIQGTTSIDEIVRVFGLISGMQGEAADVAG
ncbi:MAG: GspE/PulE family protein [Pseudomonadota bacterium]